MAQKKKTLVVAPFDDITVVAITTSLKDYKLSWHLNESLRLDLKKMAGIELAEAGESVFSFYYFDAGENLNVFNLIQLQNDGVKMLKFPMPVDFLFIVRNTIPDGKLEEWLTAMRHIPNLTMAFELDITKFKNIDPLLETIELHEFNLLREQNQRRQPKS
ncbi:MAG TPA: IPExxxVDY family protein [Bacteroidales bacterium]|nr:IPExxxVDY family protein [Bacteroidales bacterium]